MATKTYVIHLWCEFGGDKNHHEAQVYSENELRETMITNKNWQNITLNQIEEMRTLEPGENLEFMGRNLHRYLVHRIE